MATASRDLFGGGASVNSTSATPVTISSFTVAEAEQVRFEGEIIGFCAATAEIVTLSFFGGARRAVAGNVSVPASSFGSAGGGEGSLGGASVQITTTNPDTVNVQAVGIAAKTIAWNCLGRIVRQA